MIESLDNINKVVINDLTTYDPEKCNNGGGYGFYIVYTRIDDTDKFMVSHETTADMDYCPCCGAFDDHLEYVYDDDGNNIVDCEYSCGGHEVISEEELLKKVNSIKESDNLYITYN